MEIRVHRPYVILKDRPYLNDNLEIDLGEIIITSVEYEEVGRFKNCPINGIFSAE